MRNDKKEALSMRLEGRSYSEISKILNIPKSTLSSWLSEIKLSQTAKENIWQKGSKKAIDKLIIRNQEQTRIAVARSQKIRKDASSTIKNLRKNDLFHIGIALYWAEGYKRPVTRMGREITSHKISLTNSDPDLIKIFIKFLRNHLGVSTDKIKIALRIFDHQDDNNLKKFWHDETGLPMENFYKTYRGTSISSQGKRPFNRLPYGVAQITVSDTQLFHKLMGYLEGIKKLM